MSSATLEIPPYVMDILVALARETERLADLLSAPICWEYRRVLFAYDTIGKTPGVDEVHHYDEQGAVLNRLGAEGWEVFVTAGNVIGPLKFWLKRRSR